MQRIKPLYSYGYYIGSRLDWEMLKSRCLFGLFLFFHWKRANHRLLRCKVRRACRHNWPPMPRLLLVCIAGDTRWIGIKRRCDTRSNSRSARSLTTRADGISVRNACFVFSFFVFFFVSTLWRLRLYCVLMRWERRGSASLCDRERRGWAFSYSDFIFNWRDVWCQCVIMGTTNRPCRSCGNQSAFLSLDSNI